MAKLQHQKNPTFLSRELVSKGFTNSFLNWFFTLPCVTTWLISRIPVRNLSDVFACRRFHRYYIQSNLNISVLKLHGQKYQLFA